VALRNLGLLENILGHYEAARALLEQSLEIFGKMGSGVEALRADSLDMLGDAVLNLGDYERARAIHEQAARDQRRAGDFHFLGYTVRRLAHLALLEGHHHKAFDLCAESLRLNQSIGDARAVLACLAKFAAIAASQGELSKAARLAAVVERECAETGLRLLFMDRNEFDVTLSRLRTEMDPTTFGQAYAAGEALPLGAALELALQETPSPGSTQNSRGDHAA
jgi:tetratricopeptide (TPR) repeat protein